MPENGFAILREYRELFDELGKPPGTTKLRRILNRASTQVRVAPDDTLDLYKVIIDDPIDRQDLNLDFIDVRIFKIWGGVFDDGTHSNEDYATRVQSIETAAETALNAACLPGGGILYNGVLQPIDTARTYQRGFTLRGVVQEWFVITQRIKGVR